MVDAQKLQTIDRFYGINNVDPNTRLVPVVLNREYVYPLQQASNLLIDNSFAMASRPGYDDVLSGGTDIHSLWSDGTLALYVDSTTLKRLNTDYTTASLRTGLTAGARMSYAPWNDKVYYTNGYEIGYHHDLVSNLLTDPVLEFKRPLPAGQLIELHRNFLLVARGNVLYIGDILCDYYDVRYGYKQFASHITLLRSVDTGLYVGDEKVWWLPGEIGEEFDRKEAYESKPIIHTDTRLNGSEIGSGIKGHVAIWTGENGICVGDEAGQVTNMTAERYTFPSYGQGSCMIRVKDNVQHYINSLY